MRKNIRLDSLPSNRQIASKDCRFCTKRRIKCDRSIPRCRKCISRGLCCPGFDRMPLKWDQGVASRGKLAGRTHPVPLCGESKDHERLSDAPSSPNNPTSSHDPGTLTLTRCKSPPRSSSTLIPSPTNDLDIVNHCSSAALSDNLLNHFHIEVAARLTWLDSSNNPWRSMVLPFAQQSLCLRLSVLGLAAAHLSVTSASGDSEKQALLQINHNLRETSLCALNNKIRSELGRDYATEDDNSEGSSLIEMLATMLVLCYGETLVPYSTDWSLHLRACRAIIDRQRLRGRQEDPQGPVAKFLVKEVADLETFGNFSVFTRGQGTIAPLPPPSLLEGQFWAFTSLLREITVVERQRYDLSRKGRRPPDIDMIIWRTKIEQAYAQTCTGTTSISAGEEHTRKKFEAVIRAHYYSSLIYCYQALASVEEASQAIGYYISLLFDEIQFIAVGPTRIFSHNIFFPLFIAGTEYGADEHGQSIIQALFLEAITTSGFWCNHSALQFLRAFWARTESQRTWKWITYARENEQHIGPFLVF
ncbi:hypothetical protein EYZ11_009798 [Aspergillus tanneri]|uniref:Zn(2)-C6 fungal-type domain-containing protein n=1 Tax=Aspergillus tanneri TaxID=1220188 RepID=A0A4S3JCB6_9EURO|nr:uncharacterized protein ATNIH1004_005995 [Aspergillus tanneri]KAA8647304.1 hypothetical protein ATNIH1004_005995 [Aspergillus tanneri]THC90731.1 hypothetical protein EYZ11_009798 [Aspergillus tanneri]